MQTHCPWPTAHRADRLRIWMSDTNFKTCHQHSNFRTDGICIFRLNRLAWHSGGVAILIGEDYQVAEWSIGEDDWLLQLPIAGVLCWHVILPTQAHLREIHELKALMLADLKVSEIMQMLTGLTPLVSQLTRGTNTLDKLFVSKTMLHKCQDRHIRPSCQLHSDNWSAATRNELTYIPRTVSNETITFILKIKN